MTCKFRSTASISFALPCTTAVSTQLAGNPMMALCAVWVSHSRPRKVPEGGLQEAIPGYRGSDSWRVHGKDIPYLFRKYSVPFPGPFSMMTSSTALLGMLFPCVLATSSLQKVNRITSKTSNHESLERASTTQLGVFRVNQRLI